MAAGRVFAINLLANSKPAEAAFGRVGKAAGRLKSPMGIATAAIAATFAAVSAVAIKSFKALLDLGEEFNEVTRIISVGTGAIGSDLAALEDSFRDVAANAPNAFEDIATVIAELDTRTDLAGDGLEEMAVELLTLSRLMGGDAKTTTREVTRLFNRFGLSADEASDMLNILFRASQASGAEVSQLAADVTKNAGALQGMGLSLEESVALIALFEREGVRTRTVVSALQTGFLKLTKDATVPLNEALADTFTELQTLDREAAIAKGLEIFGTSALELVDAVRDGRLEVDDFTRQIVDGQSDILETAEATDGWRVKLDELKNFLKLEFEDVAREVFTEVTELVDGLKGAAERVSDAYETGGLKGALEQVAIEWNRIYEEQIEPLWVRFLEFLQDTVKPIALALGEEIGGAIASGMWSAFKAGVSQLFGSRFGERVLEDLGTDGTFSFPTEIDLTPWNRRQDVFDLPSMGGPVPDFTPPPREDRNTGGRGGSGGGGTVAPGRSIEYAPGLFAYVPFAEGGIVTSPVMGLVGEAGPEAIIPLDRMNNLSGGDVYVTVTSADPQAVVEAIRRYTRSNGPLGQVVVL